MKVDICLLGMFFSKIIKKWEIKSNLDKEIHKNVYKLVNSMMCKPEDRLDLGVIWSFMDCYLAAKKENDWFF